MASLRGIGYIQYIQMLASQKIHGAAEFRLKRHEECTKQHLVVRTAGGRGGRGGERGVSVCLFVHAGSTLQYVLFSCPEQLNRTHCPSLALSV